jgi:hypothetical protein
MEARVLEMSQMPVKVELSSVPRWAVEKYPERQADQERWLVSYYFWSRWDGNPAKIHEINQDAKMKARAIAEAGLQAIDNVLDLEQVSGETAISLIVEAEEEKWYRFAEVSDLVEFLHDKMDEYQESAEARGTRRGGVYEVANLIKVIQALVSMGVPKEMIIPIRHNLTKARYASGEMARIIASDLPEKEKQKLLKEILEQIANHQVTVNKFLENNQRRALEAVAGELPIDGMVSILREGEIIFVRSPDHAMTSAIQHALRGLVNGWSVTDAVELATRITDEISTKDKYRPTRVIQEGQSYTLIQGGEGIMMPTPERFETLVMMEVGRSMELVSQILESSPSAYLPIFRIGSRIESEDRLERIIRKEFHLNEASPFSKLREAVCNFYKLPQELDRIYRVVNFDLTWSSGKQLEYGIDLEEEK